MPSTMPISKASQFTHWTTGNVNRAIPKGVLAKAPNGDHTGICDTELSSCDLCSSMCGTGATEEDYLNLPADEYTTTINNDTDNMSSIGDWDPQDEDACAMLDHVGDTGSAEQSPAGYRYIHYSPHAYKLVKVPEILDRKEISPLSLAKTPTSATIADQADGCESTSPSTRSQKLSRSFLRVASTPGPCARFSDSQRKGLTSRTEKYRKSAQDRVLEAHNNARRAKVFWEEQRDAMAAAVSSRGVSNVGWYSAMEAKSWTAWQKARSTLTALENECGSRAVGITGTVNPKIGLHPPPQVLEIDHAPCKGKERAHSDPLKHPRDPECNNLTGEGRQMARERPSTVTSVKHSTTEKLPHGAEHSMSRCEKVVPEQKHPSSRASTRTLDHGHRKPAPVAPTLQAPRAEQNQTRRSHNRPQADANLPAAVRQTPRCGGSNPGQALGARHDKAPVGLCWGCKREFVRAIVHWLPIPEVHCEMGAQNAPSWGLSFGYY